jgi:hypothetical protein
LEEIIFENFNIFENNIISVKLAKVLKYVFKGNLGLSQGKFIIPQKSWFFPGKQSCPLGKTIFVTPRNNLNLFSLGEQSYP